MTVLIVIALFLFFAGTLDAKPRRSHHAHQEHHKIAKKGAWAGAGFAAGRAAGPVGSATVGVAKYRKDLKAGGHRRNRAVRKIGGPIAAGAIAGPPGVVGYEAVDHRHWIKRHLFPHRRHNK
jgi:hypothetical protein